MIGDILALNICQLVLRKTMGKKSKRHGHGPQKKTKNSNQSADTNSPEGTKKCSHITKAVKLGVLQNHIPHMKLGQCSLCNELPGKDVSICVCLRCGKQGCDRYSDDKHGLAHYQSTQSHCITVNLQSLMVWCYACDMDIPVVPNTDLHDCIKLLLKALKLDGPSNDSLLPKVVLTDVTQDAKIMAKHYHPLQSVKGLVNLGNTCFFNAVMQNLCQTELLHLAMTCANQEEYLQRVAASNDDLPAMQIKVTTPAGSLTTALGKVLTQMKSSVPGPLSPKHLFAEICKKAPRFRGFQQQDSQELLRYLLDSLKTEQLRRVKIGLLNAFGVEAEERGSLKLLSEDKKNQVREYVKTVTGTVVDSVFGGQLDSIVVCHQCHKESRVTESFLDLSLSLTPIQTKPIKANLSTRKLKSPVSTGTKVSPGKQQGKETDDGSPQKLSKHQLKAAKKAERKKGKRNKGKQRKSSSSQQEEAKAGSDHSDDVTNDPDVVDANEINDDSTCADEEKVVGGESKDPNGKHSPETTMEELSPPCEEKEEIHKPDSNQIEEVENRKSTPNEEKEITFDKDELERGVENHPCKNDDRSLKMPKNSDGLQGEEKLQNSDTNGTNDMSGFLREKLVIGENSNAICIDSTGDMPSENHGDSFETSNSNGGSVCEEKCRTNAGEVVKDINLDDTSVTEEQTLKDLNVIDEHEGLMEDEQVICCESELKVDNMSVSDTEEEEIAKRKRELSERRVQDFVNIDNEADIEALSLENCESEGDFNNCLGGMADENCEHASMDKCFLELDEETFAINEPTPKVNDEECSSCEPKVVEKCGVDVNGNNAGSLVRESACSEKVASDIDKLSLRANAENVDLGPSNIIQEDQQQNNTNDIASNIDKLSCIEGTRNSKSIQEDIATMTLTDADNCLGIIEPGNKHFEENNETVGAEELTNTHIQPTSQDYHKHLENGACEVSTTNDGNGHCDNGNMNTQDISVTNSSDLNIEPQCIDLEPNNLKNTEESDKKSTNGSKEEIPDTHDESQKQILTSENIGDKHGNSGNLTSLSNANDVGPGDNSTHPSPPRVLTLSPPYLPSPGECSLQSCLSIFCAPEVLDGKNKFACEECSKRIGDNGNGTVESGSDTSEKDESSTDEAASAKSKRPSPPPKRRIVYTEATKQLLLSRTPPVLTLHLKRFQQVGFGLRKVPKHVDFPLVLDLAPFCSRQGKNFPDVNGQILYSLTGLVEHSGGLNSGHYTAYIKSKTRPTLDLQHKISTIADLYQYIQDMWTKRCTGTDRRSDYTHARAPDGQWYYVSDSHVTMVPEARVIKSQAYMLFYERLPLVSSST